MQRERSRKITDEQSFLFVEMMVCLEVIVFTKMYYIKASIVLCALWSKLERERERMKCPLPPTQCQKKEKIYCNQNIIF